MKFINKYSGEKSNGFWNAINQLPEPNKQEITLAAIILQEVEEKVISALNNAIEEQSQSTLSICPFCGSSDLNLCPDSSSKDAEWFVECTDCSASGSLLMTKEEAAIAWNHRYTKC